MQFFLQKCIGLDSRAVPPFINGLLISLVTAKIISEVNLTLTVIIPYKIL